MDESRLAAEANRLLPLARRVLRRYPFVTRTVEHLETHSNVMYRVVADNGTQMVLRVGTPHANTRSNIAVEVAWLDALNRDTSLEVVRPIHTADGEMIVDEFDDDLGEERSCVLFSWIPGTPLAQGAGSFGYRLLGQMSASLQLHGRDWWPDEPVELRRWNRVFYYGSDVDPVIINDPNYGHLFDVPRRSTIAKAATASGTVIEHSWSDAQAQVVHGDLHEWNVHIAGSRLYAFDFEDVMLALPAQDAAISLYSSRRSTQKQEIRGAFRKGFETVAPWPLADESQLDGFHAARQIMLMNYAARTLPVDEAASYLDDVMPWLEAYVARYG